MKTVVPLLDVRNLEVGFPGEDGAEVQVVNGVSLVLDEGESLCLVGESGSGKTVTALSIMGLADARLGARLRGGVYFKGSDLLTKGEREMASIRGRSISIVFQDPMSTLNPVLRVGRQVAEADLYHLDSLLARRRSQRSSLESAVSMLGSVGLPDPSTVARRYPHELSGGMCQRVVIAMALMGRPSLLIADEPTTALDVTTQAQILDLLARLREETGMALLLITHDMGVARAVADRVSVMYAGRIVETAPAASLFARPRHPYTKGLIASVPSIAGPRQDRLPAIPGFVPSPSQSTEACAFAPRCTYATERCRTEVPTPRLVDGHRVSCWNAESLA